MTIPNIKYRVSGKKKHYNTCSNNNNNCIEQPFKNNTQWSGDVILDKQDEARVQPPPTTKCSLRLLGKYCMLYLMKMIESTQTATILI